MPELPEVETTKNGLIPAAENTKVSDLIVRCKALRWPIEKNLSILTKNQPIISIERRGKYLLFRLSNGTIIFHLGMSGHFKVCDKSVPLKKHDHIDIELSNGKILRYNDPRRFGACLWTEGDPLCHPLLVDIGPEPLSRAFNAGYLLKNCKNKKANIKAVIMNSKVVPGVGNIYASESLFLAKISPLTKACDLTENQASNLVKAIKSVLKKAIKQGGTTLKDFSGTDGKPGYFAQKLKVYGMAGHKCTACNSEIEKIVLQQRATYFCPNCQKATN